MRRLFKLIFQLVAAALFILLCTVAWIIFDGLTDVGEKADVALLTGPWEYSAGKAEQPRLDRVVKLYNDEEFRFIVLSGPRERGTDDKPAAMAKYLESHGIPSDSIIVDHRSETTPETAHYVAEMMKSRQFNSVMVITDYYHVTRMKLTLSHEGVADIQKTHMGKLQKEDALAIGREVVALYNYIGRVYLVPAAEKAKEEAQVGLDKAKVDAEKAKEKVDKGLDNMAK